MKIKRREFLAKSLAGVGGIIVGNRVLAGSKYYDPFETVELGKTGINTSRISLGTGMKGWQRSSNHTRMGVEKFNHLVRTAYDRGVRMFDMADLYGTHPYLLPALEGIPREEYAILTKIWFRSGGIPDDVRPDADEVVKRFLNELGTNYIDVVHLHCVVSPKWNVEQRRQMDILEDLKQQGLIRAHGVSCHTLDALKVAAEDPWVDVVNARINAFGVKMDDVPEKVVPVLQQIHDAGKGIVGMKLVGEGQFRDDPQKRQESIDYVLNLKTVDAMTVGFEKVEELDDFADAVRKVNKV
jgi:aryl-alcohol dehydrogenase-like predicted oxidoreductase